MKHPIHLLGDGLLSFAILKENNLYLYTDCQSITGRFLYSDEIYYEPPYEVESEIPLLNTLTRIPIIGHVAGLMRAILAIIHSLGHLFAALIFNDKGHLYHAAKGGVELLRGIIEMIPIIGTIFAWMMMPGGCQRSCRNYEDLILSEQYENFFLIKIESDVF